MSATLAVQCVVEDALTPAEVDALLAELQAATELDTSMGKEGELMVHQSAEDGTVRRWPFPYHFGPAFTALIDNPRITPLMHGRLGADVKLDHEYVQTLKPHPDGSGIAVARGGIHGGPANHATKITGSGRGELMTVVYELLDVAPEDGGFGAVTVRTTPHLPRCFCDGLSLPDCFWCCMLGLAPHAVRAADLSPRRPGHADVPRHGDARLGQEGVRDRLHRVHDAHDLQVAQLFLRVCRKLQT